MKKILILFVLAVILTGCGQKSEEIVLNEQELKQLIKEGIEENKNGGEVVIENEEATTKEENKNTVVKDQVEDKSLNNNFNKENDLAIYKNEKYNYSFKYPKDWYIYEDIGKFSEYGGEIVNENAVVLSKKKLNSDEVGILIGYGFMGGDILIDVTKTEKIGSNDFPYADDFRKDFGVGDYEIGGIKGKIIPVLENTEYPRWDVTRIYARKNGYDYEIIVQQLDDKGNIDLELMKVINSFEFIEDKQVVDKNKLSSLCSIQQDPEDNCDGVYLGAEFNKKTNKCESISWGCDDPPFESVDECKKVCEKQP